MFSLTFSSACKGTLTGKAKICARGAICLGGGGGGGGGGGAGRGGSGVSDKAPLSLANLGAIKFSETSFPHFKTYFVQVSDCHL